MAIPAESWATSPGVRASMKANRGRDTAPEMAVRRLLHRTGWRYRVDTAPLTGVRRRADLVFRSRRVAVFIDGCFWHGCPQHWTRAKSNSDYWQAKVTGNRARDLDTDRVLVEAGWVSMRFWEHEDPAGVAARIDALLSATQPRAGRR